MRGVRVVGLVPVERKRVNRLGQLAPVALAPDRFFNSSAASHSAFISRHARCDRRSPDYAGPRNRRVRMFGRFVVQDIHKRALEGRPAPLVALPFAQFIGGPPWRVHTPEQAAQLVQRRLDVARAECVAGRVASAAIWLRFEPIRARSCRSIALNVRDRRTRIVPDRACSRGSRTADVVFCSAASMVASSSCRTRAEMSSLRFSESVSRPPPVEQEAAQSSDRPRPS